MISRSRRNVDGLLKLISMIATLGGLSIFIVIIVKLILEGSSSFRLSFFISPLSHRAGESGILPAIVGSIWVVTLSLIISAPVGILTAIYLEEVASPRDRLAKFISVSVTNLAGVPSVVVGLVGLAVFVRGFHFGASLLSGAFTLALVVLPTVVIVSREALRASPFEYREAAFGLGASKWQIIRGQVLPEAWPRILTGLLIAIGRALGETAPLIVVGAAYFVTRMPNGVQDAYTVLPLQIFNWSSDPRREFHQDAAAATLALVLLLMAVNLGAIIYRSNSKARSKR